MGATCAGVLRNSVTKINHVFIQYSKESKITPKKNLHDEQNIILNKDRILPFTYITLPHSPHLNRGPGKNVPILRDIKHRFPYIALSKLLTTHYHH